MDQAGAFAWRPRAHFGTPLTRFLPPQGAPPMASVGALAYRPRPHFGTPLKRFMPPRELHQWPQWVFAWRPCAYVSAFPWHASYL